MKKERCGYEKNDADDSGIKTTKSIDIVVCKICQKTFPGKQSMRKHIWESHKEIKMYKCQSCDMIFPKSIYLKEHMKSVHSDYSSTSIVSNDYIDAQQRSIDCPICHKSYSALQNLKWHISQIHPLDMENAMKTLHEDEEFMEVVGVRNELIEKSEESKSDTTSSSTNIAKFNQKKFPKKVNNSDIVTGDIDVTYCDQCNSPQNSKEDHIKHLKTKHKAQQVCDECFKCFQTGQSLKRHRVKAHGFKLRYQCNLCSYVCKSEYLIKVHFEVKHAGHQNIDFSAIKEGAEHLEVKCEACDKIFKDVWKYKFHKERVHDKQKRFECTKCGQKFAWRKCINRHNANFHEGSEEHTIYLVNKHVQKDEHNTKPYTCPVCNTGFIKVSTINKHLKSFHPEQANDFLPITKPEPKKKFYCPICDYKGTDSERYFKEHLRTEHLEKYYELYLKPDDKFQCPMCNKGFKILKSFNEHIQNKHPENSHLVIESENERKNPEFECPNCFKKYVNAKSFQKHIKLCDVGVTQFDEIFVTDDDDLDITANSIEESEDSEMISQDIKIDENNLEIQNNRDTKGDTTTDEMSKIIKFEESEDSEMISQDVNIDEHDLEVPNNSDTKGDTTTIEVSKIINVEEEKGKKIKETKVTVEKKIMKKILKNTRKPNPICRFTLADLEEDFSDD